MVVSDKVFGTEAVMDLSGVPSLGKRNGTPVVFAAIAGEASGLRSGTEFGASLVLRDGRSMAPPLLDFRCETTAGPHEVWVEYAAFEPRPMALLLDGLVMRRDAVAEVTGGWNEADADWRFQGGANLTAGPHSVTLRGNGNIPHLRRVALVPVEAGVMPKPAIVPPVPGLANEYGFSQDAEWFRFVAEASPAIRRMLARRADPNAMLGLLQEMVGAIARDIRLPHERQGFGGPFNGQLRRHRLFDLLDRTFLFDALVETGSFVGTSTELLARLGRPVFSCEIDRAYYMRALTRLQPYPDARVFQADSRSFLRHFCGPPSAEFRMPFFYLDAHWHEDLPLPEEIDIIAARFPEFVIFCDDFQHPFHDYGYDRYATGIELTLDYLKPRLTGSAALAFLFPLAPPEIETGAKRGTLVVMPRRMYEEHIQGRPAAAEFTDPF